MVLNVILYQRGARLRCRIPSHQPLRDKKNQNKTVSWLHTHWVQVCLRESWCFRRAQRGALAKVLSENPQSPQAGNARTSIVTNCEIGHLCRSPPQDRWPHAKGRQRGQVLLLAEHKSHLSLLLPLLLLHLQSNLGRLHSFLLREVQLYCMCSLLIEILDITSPEDLEILQLNGKNTLDRRAQTDGDTLHASNINKILILR